VTGQEGHRAQCQEACVGRGEREAEVGGDEEVVEWPFDSGRRGDLNWPCFGPVLMNIDIGWDYY
jgi:hypothetical protein